MKRMLIVVLCAGSGSLTHALPQKLSLDIKGTSLAQLMSLKITSLSRKQEALSQAPAAAYVITRDEIRRMGVTHVAEVLRYVPGVQVARLEANKWAISIRGFNSRAANKLLVMIDGRSIYSPLFSGVLWEEKDLVLDDIERIEVIRGPGGTQWGANAVNGVINIITRDARLTQGGEVRAGFGREERSLTQARYGWSIDPQTHARIYGKFTQRDDSGSGPVADDSSRTQQSGFRIDHNTAGQGHLTLQGDVYQGDIGPESEGLGTPGQEHNGGNLQLGWSYAATADRRHELKAYYDATTLITPGLNDRRHLLNFDYQLLQRWQNHEVVGGAGYRYGSDAIGVLPPVVFIPPQRSDELKSAFIQDDMAFLDDRLHLIAGSKYEHNDYSGEEWQPSLRTSYAFSDALLWAAASRVTRTPTRLEHDISVPGIFVGGRNLQPEHARVYELGWRQQWQNTWQLDLAAYHADYDDLLTTEPPTLGNKMSGNVQGIETSVSAQVLAQWLLRLNYSYADMDLSVSPDSTGTTQASATEGNLPQNMLQVISLWDINPRWQMNTYLRYVDELPAQKISDYWAGDITLVWRPASQTTVQLAARHLGGDEHKEWGSSANAIEQDLTLTLSQEF